MEFHILKFRRRTDALKNIIFFKIMILPNKFLIYLTYNSSSLITDESSVS